MRIITRNSDNLVVMFSNDGKPEAAADQTAHDLTDQQAESVALAISQPNGGVTFDGESFAVLPAPAPPKPRAMCSAWQFRKEARVRGIKADVDALIAQQDEETKEAFEYATEYWSDNPMLLALAAQLPTPLTEEQVYEMVVAASARVVGVP